VGYVQALRMTPAAKNGSEASVAHGKEDRREDKQAQRKCIGTHQGTSPCQGREGTTFANEPEAKTHC